MPESQSGDVLGDVRDRGKGKGKGKEEVKQKTRKGKARDGANLSRIRPRMQPRTATKRARKWICEPPRIGPANGENLVLCKITFLPVLWLALQNHGRPHKYRASRILDLPFAMSGRLAECGDFLPSKITGTRINTGVHGDLAP